MLDNIRESIERLMLLDSSLSAIQIAYIKDAMKVEVVDGDYCFSAKAAREILGGINQPTLRRLCKKYGVNPRLESRKLPFYTVDDIRRIQKGKYCERA